MVEQKFYVNLFHSELEFLLFENFSVFCQVSCLQNKMTLPTFLKWNVCFKLLFQDSLIGRASLTVIKSQIRPLIRTYFILDQLVLNYPAFYFIFLNIIMLKGKICLDSLFCSRFFKCLMFLVIRRKINLGINH